MRIAAARLSEYRLPLLRPWRAAAATLAVRRGWLLRLTDEDGVTGWGDCAPLPSSSKAMVAAVAGALQRLANALPGSAPGAALAGDVPPEVRWALETALLDLDARRRGLPLARVLGARELAVPVNAALGALDDASPERACAALAQGYAVAKLKVGMDDVAEELARLAAVADASGGRLRLRLDANRAWDLAQASRFLAGACRLPIEAIEEPLADPTVATLRSLQAQSPIALAVDESLPLLDAPALFAARAVRRLVVKPARIGGLRATLALATQARQADMDCVVTSVVDSAIGVMAAAHVAAALNGGTHGLATSGWLAADVAQPPLIVAGCLRLDEAPGLGLVPMLDPAHG